MPPTSNGQFTARDIRKQSIDTLHLRPGAVVTDTIEDLAVTFPDKLDDPTWSTTFGGLLFHNETVTTTPTSFGTLLVDVPAWVNAVSVFAHGYFQLSNTSGSTVLMSAGVEIAGEVEGGNSQSCANNETEVMNFFRVANLIGLAGSSFFVDAEVSISSGTNASNHASIAGIVVGHR